MVAGALVQLDGTKDKSDVLASDARVTAAVSPKRLPEGTLEPVYLTPKSPGPYCCPMLARSPEGVFEGKSDGVDASTECV
jgi:hypothetical protein